MRSTYIDMTYWPEMCERVFGVDMSENP